MNMGGSTSELASGSGEASAGTPIRITIVTPSFNQCSYLGRTAESILSQKGSFALRWLVLDGGSTDGTLDLLRSIGDPRLRWVSEADRGQAHAINKGLDMGEGDVVAWLNSDDLYAPGRWPPLPRLLRREPMCSGSWGAARSSMPPIASSGPR